MSLEDATGGFSVLGECQSNGSLHLGFIWSKSVSECPRASTRDPPPERLVYSLPVFWRERERERHRERHREREIEREREREGERAR